MALVRKDAAMLVKDSDAVAELMKTACSLIEDHEKIALLEKNIGKCALSDAAMTIAEEVYRIIS